MTVPINPHEREEAGFPPILIVDENDPGNILGDITRPISLSRLGFSHYSGEGFAENPQLQQDLAWYLIRRLGLQRKGPLLDVGYGANLHPAIAFVAAGIPAVAIDLLTAQPRQDDPFHPPQAAGVTETGVEIYSGDVVKLHGPDSQLKDKRFGIALFNGSYSATGNNFTVAGEVVDFKFQHDAQLLGNEARNPNAAERDQHNTAMLTALREGLVPGGVIGVVSSRYAFHGGGYGFSDLPTEKVHMLDLYDKLARLGTTKVTLIGVTQEGLSRIVERSIQLTREKLAPGQESYYYLENDEISLILAQLNQADTLPFENELYYGENSPFVTARARELRELAAKTPEFSQLARIDALFAEFP